MKFQFLHTALLSHFPQRRVAPTSAPVIGAAALRSATNRDLTADLERIASLGVKLIINCLSDEELTFLGVPWPKYIATARKLGIDVLRMPMPEGLSPLNVEDMDKEIARIINQCTTKGIDVLAHCRGGIGRVRIPSDMPDPAVSDPSLVTSGRPRCLLLDDQVGSVRNPSSCTEASNRLCSS